MLIKCSGQKYLLTAICNLLQHYLVKPGSSLFVWWFFHYGEQQGMDCSIRDRYRYVERYSAASLTRNARFRREKLCAQGCTVLWSGSRWLQHLSSVYDIVLSLGMWLFHALINTEENQWIRKESAFRLVTLFNVQRGRISEEPTAPNTIHSLINAKGLIE